MAQRPTRTSLQRSQRLSDQWNLDNVKPTPAAFDLSLKAVSSSKQIVSKVLLASPLQLKATLFDPTATYTTFAVESCHASSGGVMHANIIDRGCPNPETDFGGNFLTYVFAQPGRDAPTTRFSPKSLSTASSFISIISSQFPAFVLSPNSNPNESAHIDSSRFQSNSSSILVKIICAFRLCAHRAWCSLPNQCDGNHEKHQRTTFMPPKIHFAVRSLILEVLNPSPHHSDESNSLGTQSCTSVFCQPRVQLLLIMVSLGAMLCLSMICGCLVSRNHYLFHLKSSTSSPNLTICPPNGNFLTLRHSNDGSKPSPTTQPNHLLPQNGVDEISVSAAFLQHEPEQNYMQFYNPPQFQSTHQHFHTLPSTCIHETYQTLPHRRHLQCGQDLFTSPQIDNRRGLVYANGDMSEVQPTLLVPVTANTHINRTQHRKNEPEWILDNHQQSGNSSFVLETSTPVEPNNHAPGIEISNIPRNSCGVVENRPLCLISGVKTLGSSPGTRPITLAPETLYRLPSKLYMMPEFSYCLASSTCTNANNSVTAVSGDNHGSGGTSDNPIEGELLD
ncbi:hypothetical protein ACTXT7_001984 [Hymenolepis weldensis]